MKISTTRLASVSVIVASILMLGSGLVSAYQAPCLVRPVESTPVRLEELEFSVVTQDEWRAFRYWGSKFNADPDRQDEVPLQLRIVNRGSKSIVVPTFDSFTPILKGPDGKEMALGKGRDYTLATAPILLKPGQGYSYAMIARLVEPHDGDGIEFIFKDRTGGGGITPMKPGIYSLYFKLHSTGLINDVAPGADIWITSGTTGTVTFRVVSVPKS
jgi:hypothetical protein